MPFDRDTSVIPSNIVLHRGPGPPTGSEDLGVVTPVHSNAAYRQITLAVEFPFLYVFFVSVYRLR